MKMLSSGGCVSMLRIAAAFLAWSALWSCGEGGWGSGYPDTFLGDLPDGGAGGRDGAAADGGVQDAGVAEDAADTTDGGPAYECGKGPGNAIGVGKACTKGGKQCTGDLSCDVDLDPKGVGICILIACTRTQECGGGGAKCCAPAQSGGIKICLPPECLPPECGGAVPDGGIPDGSQDSGSGGDGA